MPVTEWFAVAFTLFFIYLFFVDPVLLNYAHLKEGSLRKGRTLREKEAIKFHKVLLLLKKKGARVTNESQVTFLSRAQCLEILVNFCNLALLIEYIADLKAPACNISKEI